MSLYFVGNEWDAYTLSGTSLVTQTSGTFHDTTYTRMSMEVKETSNITGFFNATSTEGWLHFMMVIQIIDGQMTSRYVELRDSVRNAVVMRMDSNNAHPTFDINIGGVLTQQASFLITVNQKFTFDMHWVISTDPDKGLVEWFINENLNFSQKGSFLSTTSFNMIDSVRLHSPRNGVENIRHAHYSQVVAASVPTLGWHVATIVADSTGASTDWTGTSTNIGGAALNDTTFIESTVANQVELNVCTDLSGSRPTGQTEVIGLAIAARHGQTSTTGPDQLQVALRTSGSNHFSSNLVEPVSASTSYDGGMRVFDTNPIGSSVWTITDIDALEIGVRSIA